MAKPEQFEELGIPAYVAIRLRRQDNSGGGDGVPHGSVQDGYRLSEITELAKSSTLQDRGETRRRLEEPASSGAFRPGENLSAVVWFSSTQVDADPYVAGKFVRPPILFFRRSASGMSSEEEWPTVGWETIAKSGPSMIVAAKLDRRRYPAIDITVNASSRQ